MSSSSRKTSIIAGQPSGSPSGRHETQALFKIEETRPLPPVFRVGRRLFYMSPVSSKDTEPHAWATKEGIITDSNYSTSAPTAREIQKYLLSKDGTEFHIESFDLDISFKIGDKVVFADWKNPINMLMVRTIAGFKIDSGKNSLDFILMDKDGNLIEVPYITPTRGDSRSSGGASCIQVGKIRKITNKFNKVSSGTKIIAEKGYIPLFPKKDVNIIIGFITDTGGDDPLVLCSNCCTLWFSDMMANFKRITMKSKQWAQLPHSPIDITKIKPQPGDVLNGIKDFKDDYGWMILRMDGNKTPRVMPLNYYTSHPETYTLDNYIRNNTVLDCIPAPRIGQTEQTKLETVHCWPNFHGLFLKSRLSQLQFLNDERSVMHVQSSCE